MRTSPSEDINVVLMGPDEQDWPSSVSGFLSWQVLGFECEMSPMGSCVRTSSLSVVSLLKVRGVAGGLMEGSAGVFQQK